MKNFLVVDSVGAGKVVSAELETDVVLNDGDKIRELTPEEDKEYTDNKTVPAFDIVEKKEDVVVPDETIEDSTASNTKDEVESLEKKEDSSEHVEAEKKEDVVETKVPEIDLPHPLNATRKIVRAELIQHADTLIKNIIALKEAASDGSALPNERTKQLLNAIKNGASELYQTTSHWNNTR